jgi:hypothetical protein
LYITRPIYAHIVEAYEIQNQNESLFIFGKYCIQDPASLTSYLLNSICPMVFTTIPVVFLNNILSTVMIIFIYKSRRYVNNLSNNNLRDRKFAINSIVLNLTCLVLKLPRLVFSVLFPMFNFIPFSLFVYECLITISQFLFCVDSASSFFINILVNSMFYDEFLIMVKLKRSQQNR